MLAKRPRPGEFRAEARYEEDMGTSAERRKQRKRTPPPPTRASIPFFTLLRMVLVGGVSILACIYALLRYYTVTRDPILVPVPAATEIPAPELEPLPAPSR